MESALSEIKQGQFCRIKSRIDSPHLDFVKNCFKKYFKLKKDSKTDLSSTHSKKPNVSKKLAKKETEIVEMKSQIQNAEIEKKLEVFEAVKVIEKQRDNLANDLKIKETEKQLLEKAYFQKRI